MDNNNKKNQWLHNKIVTFSNTTHTQNLFNKILDKPKKNKNYHQNYNTSSQTVIIIKFVVNFPIEFSKLFEK